VTIVRSAAPRRFPAGVDLAFALAIAIGVFVLCRPYLQADFLTLRDDSAPTPDEGTILYDASRMARGHAPYREVFNFRGPYAFAPYILAFKIGPHGVRTGRIAQFAMLALLSGLAYLLALAAARRRWVALVVASWPFFVAWPAWPYAYVDFGSQLASVAAALALVCAERSPHRDGRWWIAAAGALCGIATWTSLSQGATALIAFGGGLALQSVLSDEPGRETWRKQAWYWGGFAGATLIAGAWLVPYGAVGDALWATLIFPFKYYRSGANTTTYGYDAREYLPHWDAESVWLGRMARTSLLGLLVVPVLATITALVWVARLLVRKVRGRWPSFPATTLGACALTAPAVPVLLSRTRSDVCHIGFVVSSSIFALAALIGVAARSRRRWRRAAAALGGLVLALPPIGGLSLYAYAAHKRPDPGVPLDVHLRASLLLDYYEARLAPGETYVATPYGGWYHLGSGHDNPTSFSLLYEDPYCRGQWAIAGKQIADRQPAFLAMSGTIFDLLAEREPRLRSLYFGFGGNYLLDRAQPGPPLARKRWALSRIEADGSVSDTRPIDLTVDEHLPRLFGDFGGGPLRAALYGKRFFMFAEATTYMGTLSDDGGTIEGRMFSGGTEIARFRATAP
jgi:hypothetical protein